MSPKLHYLATNHLGFIRSIVSDALSTAVSATVSAAVSNAVSNAVSAAVSARALNFSSGRQKIWILFAALKQPLI